MKSDLFDESPLTPEERAAWERYINAAHAVQTGVKLDLATDPSSASPKHLRTGLNLIMSEHAALAGVLMQKGVLTRLEYFEAIAEAVEREQRNYQNRLGVDLR